MTLSSLLTVPTFLLAISINIVMLIFRRISEIIWPSLSDNTPVTRGSNVWGRIILPTLPVLMGALFCLAAPPAKDGLLTGFAYPAVVAGIWSRVLYGVVVGWFSAYLYTVFKFLLKKEWSIDLPFSDEAAKPTAAEEKKP